MKVMALFNKKRKKQIKEALKRGDASVFRRDRPASRELEQDQTATDIRVIETGPVADGEAQMLVDLTLIQSAREGDLEGVKDALSKGADVHTPYRVTQQVRPNLGDCQFYKQMTPLEAAEEGGNPAVIELLKKHGAKK